MRFKSRSVARSARALTLQCPSLLVVLLAADYMARLQYKKSILVTSVHRVDVPATVHNLWRGADCRLANHTKNMEIDLTQAEWESLAKWINATFDYGLTQDGRKSRVVHIRIDSKHPENDHIHIQVPYRAWYGEKGV